MTFVTDASIRIVLCPHTRGTLAFTVIITGFAATVYPKHTMVASRPFRLLITHFFEVAETETCFYRNVNEDFIVIIVSIIIIKNYALRFKIRY